MSKIIENAKHDLDQRQRLVKVKYWIGWGILLLSLPLIVTFLIWVIYYLEEML